MSVTIIASDFHKDLAEEMIRAAQDELKKLGKSPADVLNVAGCYEMPLIVDRVLAKPETEAVVVLGFIEKGETMHGEVMGHVVHEKFFELELKYQKPVGMGIIGPGATPEQAKVRTERTARGAVSAALQSAELLKKLT